MRLLIAEDDKALGLFLSRGLEADGHRVRVACDGAAAVEAFRQDMPDLTILDLNMPIKDGEQVLEEVRAMDSDLPVLVLTARQEVDTRVRCLDRGADDLMVKPFSLHELRARCRALLRRKREARLQLRAGDLELDRLEHSARRAGLPIVLTNKEFALLAGGTAGLGVEPGTGADHQHCGRVRELSAPQAQGPAPRATDPDGARAGLHGAPGERSVASGSGRSHGQRDASVRLRP